MNYTKKLIASAIVLGFGITSANAQQSKFSLNGLGRAIITNNDLTGTLPSNDESFQQSGVSGYNLFDLQTNLDVDSNFKAVAILRARSPFGALFGQGTNFEFRQFTMTGNIDDFKYEIGDIRVEMTPYTVFNNDVVRGRKYESEMFSTRRQIIEYENFNQGNSWFVQGIAGEHFFKFNDNGQGIGLYAFTSRNTSTNEFTVPDRLLSGGNLEFRVNEELAIGANAVGFYDIMLMSADFDYTNLVYTGYAKYNYKSPNLYLNAIVEGGMSDYTFSQFVDGEIDRIDSSYTDGFVDVTAELGLVPQKVKFDLNFRAVGVAFSSPSAQSRRIDVNAQMNLFSVLSNDARREQLLFDRFTAEDIYNSKVAPNLMAFLPHYNNTNPYGKATPNRIGGEFGFSTDTTNKVLDAGVRVGFFNEIQGEGVEDLRSFLVLNGGAIAHLGKVLNIDRVFDFNAGVRYESTQRGGDAEVSLASTLVDAGIAFELFKKIDLMVGAKLLMAEGNEFIAGRNGFNAIVDFDEFNIDLSENLLSFGVRTRLNKNQTFSVNYNYTQMSNTLNTDGNYNLGQLFIHYRGIF